MKNQNFISKSKRKLSLLLIICMVLLHLPVSHAYAVPDPIPESGSVYVDGVDLLISDEEAYPEGISYNYVDNVNVITVSGAAITVGHPDGGKYSGISANNAGDVELVLVGNNTINIAPIEEPIHMDAGGIFIGGGTLIISGTGSLMINSEGRSIHLDAQGEAGKSLIFNGSVTIDADNQIFTEGGERPSVFINDSANVTSHGIECGNENNEPLVDEGHGARYINTDDGGGDPGPGSAIVYANGVDLLDEEAGTPDGVSYVYDSPNYRHKITLDGATLNSGYADGGRYSGICIMESGVEIVLDGDNTITIPNQTEPDMEGIGIYVAKGTLIISGTGSLTINSGGRSIHLDAQGEAGKSLIFNGSVTIDADNQIFTEGEERPSVFINDSANVTSHGIECGNENNEPLVDEGQGARYTNTDDGGGDPGGDPESNPESLYVNGINILSEDYQHDISGLTYEIDSVTDTHIITLEDASITSGYITPGNKTGIHAPSVGDVEIRLIGNNSITIPNYEDQEADPPVINGVGIYVSGGNLTISGTGTLSIDVGDRAIMLDAHGVSEPLEMTFKESVTVTANKSIFTEGDGDSLPNVNIYDNADVTAHGIQCGSDNTPTIAEGARFINTDDGGGDNPNPDEPFNLSVSGVDLVIDDVIQEAYIPNTELIYYEHVDHYSLYLYGDIPGGIYCDGNGRLGIYAEEDSVVGNLDVSGYEDYSIVLSAGAEITPYDFLKERDTSNINDGDNTLTLAGGILSGNGLAFKDNISINIGSPNARANKGIVGDTSLRVEAVNPRSINIWADEVGVEGVNSDEGFKLGSSVDINIHSNGTGATDTVFVVGEGSTLNMLYREKGNFIPTIYKWDYLDMTGPFETYANMPYTIVDELIPGTNPEDRYSLDETGTTYQLISTAKPLYTLGYNYDNDRDGIVDNPDEEIINGKLSIKGATGICQGDSEGFVDYNFEAGTLVTVELLPDYGYQYEAGTLSYNFMSRIDTTPGDTRAYYTFIMPEGHVHLYAGFVESSDIIQTNSTAITDAVVDIGQNNIHGNVAFDIDVDTPSVEERQVITNQAGTKQVGAYLDLTLNEYIAKAGTDGAWVTELYELDEPVSISMQLTNNLRGKSGYSVVRMHNNVATVIDATYSNGVITFETDRFSTYAIVYNASTSTPVYPTTNSSYITPTITPSVIPVPENQFNISIIRENDDTEGTDKTEDIEDDNMILSSEILKLAIEAGEKVTVSVRDKKDKELYIWTFDTDEVSDKVKKTVDVNHFIDILPLSDDDEIYEKLSDNHGLILSFGHNGALPVPATVRIYVGDMEDIEPGMNIYLYHHNKETGKLETLPYSSGYTVDEDGYITINIVHCSDFVVLEKEAKTDQITSLRNQIKVSVLNNLLYIGGTKGNTTGINVKIPITLELVNALKNATSFKAIGAITVSHSSSNKNVVKVDKDGVITAVGAGEAVITTKVSLYSGKIKTVKTMITVEEAHVVIKVAKTVIDVNDSYTYRAKAYGFYAKDITWSTDDEAIIVVNKTTGKAVAKSKGTGHIIAKAREAIHKIKVTVK